MPLTNDEKRELMARVAGDEVVVARQALRDAMWHWVCLPFSHARLNAFLDAFERLQDVNANRTIANIAPLIVPFDARLNAFGERLTALEQRVGRLEDGERLSGTA